MGSHADIEAARLKDLRAFFRQYYTPNNASIAIVGDINKEASQKTGREIFRFQFLRDLQFRKLT